MSHLAMPLFSLSFRFGEARYSTIEITDIDDLILRAEPHHPYYHPALRISATIEMMTILAFLTLLNCCLRIHDFAHGGQRIALALEVCWRIQSFAAFGGTEDWVQGRGRACEAQTDGAHRHYHEGR